MRIARIIGTVTLARAHPALTSLPLKLVEPVEAIDENGELVFSSDQLAACDMLGAGLGNLIALAEGPEAAQPFRPDIKPLDANAAAILDSLDL
jgi:microcompartment protein CcmK/EutM